MELPLFLVIFAGILVGLLIGFVWEWFREAKHRSRRIVPAARGDAAGARGQPAAGKGCRPKDDVLALLEGPARAR